MSKFALLLRKDFRVLYRDGLTVMVFFYAVLFALAARLAVPFVAIEHIEVYIAPAIMLFGGPMLGTLLGFTLIEEREQNTWLLLRVLPISTVGVFGYLTVMSSGLSVVMMVASAAVYGLPVAEPERFVWMLLAAAPAASLIMLIMGAATDNKIEGLALSKIVSSSSMAPLLVFVLPGAWQVLLWWHPMYWIYLGFLQAYAGEERIAELPLHWPAVPFVTFALAPLVLSGIGIVVLAETYRRRAQ